MRTLLTCCPMRMFVIVAAIELEHKIKNAVTVKNSKNSNGIRVERGMSVEVVTNNITNPVTTNGGQAVADAFMRIYGIDIRKAGALNMVYLDVQRIG